MRRFAIAGIIFSCLSTPSHSQMTFTDLASYCSAMSEASSVTLLARVQGVPRSQAEALMQGMTDPASIRMVKEVIDFAYSQQPSMGIEGMRAELRNRCLAKKIFVQ
jgi:hypothetical protein